MRGKRMMWTGLIGFVVGLIALLICLMLPVVLGPNVSWGEAALGIIPAGILTLVFLVLMLIGMATAVGSQSSRAGGRGSRAWDENDEEDEDRPRRRRRRDMDEDDD